MRAISFPCRIVAMYLLAYVAAVLHHLKTRSLPVPGRLICRVSSCGRQGQYFGATIRAPCRARLAYVLLPAYCCVAQQQLPQNQSRTKTAPTKTSDPRRRLLCHLISGAIHQSAKEQLIRQLPPFIPDTTYIRRPGKHRTLLEGYRSMLLAAAPTLCVRRRGDLLSQLSGALSDVDSHAPHGDGCRASYAQYPMTSPKARKNIDFCCATRSKGHGELQRNRLPRSTESR